MDGGEAQAAGRTAGRPVFFGGLASYLLVPATTPRDSARTGTSAGDRAPPRRRAGRVPAALPTAQVAAVGCGTCSVVGNRSARNSLANTVRMTSGNMRRMAPINQPSPPANSIL